MAKKLDYNQPIEISEGIYWVGFYDENTGLHCNPYLIIDGDEAVLIDGGSRPDFPIVMMKILKTGLVPRSIKALIYQHYDPDLCGSILNLENIIDNPELKILSTSQNHMFISHYSVSGNFVNLSSLDFEFTFGSGRRLKFISTPYAHAPGSFVTFDEKTKVLFTSDLFGSFGGDWSLFLNLDEECLKCIKEPDEECKIACPLPNIYTFHRQNFPTVRALEYAMQKIEEIDFSLIAPQHGSVINFETGKSLMKRIRRLDSVGIDGFIK